MTPDREDRLPKWARNELARLRADCASMAVRLSAGPEDSDTFADPYSQTKRPLGEGTLIEFELGEDVYSIRARLGEDHRGEKHLLLNGDRALLIEPQASNAIHVRLGR